MRILLIGILWLTVLALWGHCLRPPDPLPRVQPVPNLLPPQKPVHTAVPFSMPPAARPAPDVPPPPLAPPDLTKLLHQKSLAVAELEYARQHAERMQEDLGRLEERMIDLIRHHRRCSRGSPPVGVLRGLDGFSPAEKEFIEQSWKSRDAEAGYYRERERDVERGYHDLILGILTPEQRRTYLVLESLGWEREGH